MYTLFFVAPEDISQDQIKLVGPQAHHATAVLRVQIAEMIRLADGSGNWIEGEVIEVAKDFLAVRVKTRGSDRVPKVHITFAQALLKGENQKAALDHLVQAGVETIIPWQADRSVASIDKSKKWREVVIAAARQSRRARIPHLAPMTELQALIGMRSSFDTVIALHESSAQALSSIKELAIAKKLLVIVGPEGGLSNQELDELMKSKIPLVKLGDPVIRADLAGAIALGGLQVLIGEW